MNQQFINPGTKIREFNDFFKSVTDETVWAKALPVKGASGPVQHTLMVTDNGVPVPIPPIGLGDPVCLSKYVSFEGLKKSGQLRSSYLSGAIRLLTSNDVEAHWNAKAQTYRTTPQAVAAAAERAEQAFLNHEPLRDNRKPADPNQRAMGSIKDAVLGANTRPQAGEYVPVTEVVKPYIIDLLSRVSPMLKPAEMMPANVLRGKLEEIEDTLSNDDLEYVKSHGGYTSIKKWATAKENALAAKFEINDEAPQAASQPAGTPMGYELPPGVDPGPDPNVDLTAIYNDS